MKVCKKCKNHVANKAKICKKCGSDVTKAKIIKNVNNTKNNNSPKSQVKRKSIKNQTKPIVETKLKRKDTVVVTKKQTQKNKINNKSINTIKPILIKVLNYIKTVIIKTYTVIKKLVIYLLKEMIYSLQRTFVIIVYIVQSSIKFLKQAINKIIYLIRSILSYLKTQKTKLQQIKESEIQKEKINKVIIKKRQPEIQKRTNGKRSFKLAFITAFILSILGGVYFVGEDIYKDITHSPNKVVVTEKATREKVFNMSDIITYNNVDYKIVKVEKSNGNNYKSPKAGHQFLIVTVYIKNNTGGKIPYSYENWTMSNSKGEEKKRIFTSINVDTALYSGELVIGGIKTGSMVFEQPINDPKLIMNFYELKKDEDGNDVIDEAKRVFSISIKVPNKNEKEYKDKTANDDIKVVKTNTKNESY